MDPISGAGLAANIIQFIDFGYKVVVQAKDIRDSASGGSKENNEIETVTEDLKNITESLDQHLKREAAHQSKPTDESALQDLGRDCQSVAEELLAALKKLKTTGKSNRWDCVRRALLCVWNKEKIVQLEHRLDRFRQQLTIRLLASARDALTKVYQQQSASVNAHNLFLEAFLRRVRDNEQWRDLIDTIRNSTLPPSVEGSQEAADKIDIFISIETFRKEILSSLHFHEIWDRHNRIAERHQKTFEWIYEDSPTKPNTWVNFSEWLERGTDIYWITGKPGSGKSTLMKFLYDDPRTRKHLSKWSGDSDVVLSGFFFWNSGTERQMSYSGLLQTLLYTLVRKLPNLVDRIFAERWEIYKFSGKFDPHWSVPELSRSLRNICNAEFQKMRLLFLIDGLDEYHGDHNELVGLLQHMAHFSHIKVCAASRPLVVFQRAFEKSPSLMLQDLTTTDIELFVKTSFYNYSDFLPLEKKDPQLAREICSEVTNRAAGVFLWVCLVVQSLLAGISNGDKIVDLYRRLKELPGDLEALYEQILHSLDHFYLAHASRLFQICQAADGEISLLHLSYADEEDDKMLQVKEPIILGKGDFFYRLAWMKRRLDSRCKGLLELITNEGISDVEHDPDKLENLGKSSVQYLHRTVKDFVERPDIRKKLLAETTSFDPNIALCKAAIIEMNTVR
ncbi:uncharacterized protein BDR25DRAFT_152265, partial [Lindgomyces ingoldianus]